MNYIHGYHCHIYFDESSRDSAAALQQNIRLEWRDLVQAHGLIDKPIGPHPMPMFEVDVPAENIQPIKAWLEKYHGPHSILIHPITGDDVVDHRDHPQWIGKPLPLNLKYLEALQRRKS